VIVLHEHAIDAGCTKAGLVIALEEEAASVAKDARTDELEPGKGEFFDLHARGSASHG
jgi:hypothetical protein